MPRQARWAPVTVAVVLLLGLTVRLADGAHPVLRPVAASPASFRFAAGGDMATRWRPMPPSGPSQHPAWTSRSISGTWPTTS